MKALIFILMALATFSTDIKAQEVTGSIEGDQLQFQIGKVGNGETKGTNRTMPYMPTIYQSDHTLYIMNGLPACTLRLADERTSIFICPTTLGVLRFLSEGVSEKLLSAMTRTEAF